MKNVLKLFGIIVLVFFVLVFTTGCAPNNNDDGNGENSANDGGSGNGGNGNGGGVGNPALWQVTQAQAPIRTPAQTPKITSYPEGGHGKVIESLDAEKTTVTAGDITPFLVSVKLRNRSGAGLSGIQLRVVLVDTDGNTEVIGTYNAGGLGAGNQYTSNINNCRVPAYLSPGSYRLMILSRHNAAAADDWRRITESTEGIPTDLDFEITHNQYSSRTWTTNGFDPRPLGLLTPVSNQGATVSCWAHAVLNAFQQLALKETGRVYNFSRQHLRFGTSRVNTEQTTFQGPPEQSVGTNNALAFIMMDGVVLEEDIPFAASINSSTPLPNNFYSAPRLYRITGTITIPPGFEHIDRIKAAILEYGNAFSFWATSATNSEQIQNYAAFSRYYTSAIGARSGSHAVAIVGWDDNYPKENFTVQPPGNGAWLVKQSYGSSGTGTRVFDRGYLWMSYHDESWHRRYTYAISGFEAVTPNEKIAAHYDYAVDGNVGVNTTSSRRRLPVANVYEIFAQDAANYQISKVTFHGREDQKYNIHIIPYPAEGLPSPENLSLWGEPYAKDIVIPAMSERGWITVPLDRPYIPQAGKYIVMIDTYRVSATNNTRFDRAYGGAPGELDEDDVCTNEDCAGNCPACNCPDCPVPVPGYRAISPTITPGQSFAYNWTDIKWDDLYDRNTIEADGTHRHGGLLMQLVLQKR